MLVSGRVCLFCKVLLVGHSHNSDWKIDGFTPFLWVAIAGSAWHAMIKRFNRCVTSWTFQRVQNGLRGVN